MIRLSSKFGAKLVTVGKLMEHAGELGLEVIGVSFHVGSGCTGSLSFKQAIADARHVFDIAVSHHHFSKTLQKYSTFKYLEVRPLNRVRRAKEYDRLTLWHHCLIRQSS